MPRRPQPDWGALAEVGWFAGRLRPKAQEPLLGPGEALGFETERGAVVEADRPLLKAALMALADSWPAGLRAQPLMADAVERLRVRGLADEQVLGRGPIEQTLSDLVALCQRGQIELWCWSPPMARVLAERPRALPVARLQAGRGPTVSSPRHDPLVLDPLGRAVLGLLDGSRNLDELSLAAGQLIDGGALGMADELPIERRREYVRAAVLQRVVAIRDGGLLAPESEGAA